MLDWLPEQASTFAADIDSLLYLIDYIVGAWGVALHGLPLYILHRCFRPVHGLFDRVIEPVVRRIAGGTGSEETLTSEDVLRIAREARHIAATVTVIYQ